MFFQSKREAIKVASIGICISSIPPLNYGVLLAAAMANDSGSFDGFETMLQSVVLISAALWLPAVILFTPALTFLAINFACELLESCFEALFSNTNNMTFS